MQIFADTSDVGVIRDFCSRGLIDGVTTNPTNAGKYIEQNPMSIRELAFMIAEAAEGRPVSIEAVGTDTADYRDITARRLYREAAQIIEWNRQLGYSAFWQKIPTTLEGVTAIYLLVQDFKKEALINATLGFDHMQAMRAAEAGAHVFSLFMGRMQSAGEDAVAVQKKIIEDYASKDIATGFLAASMRTPELLISAWEAGADIATAPPQTIAELIKRFPDAFEEMKRPAKKRTVNSNILNNFRDNEFRHPLLLPGLEDFVKAAYGANYDLFS